MLIDPMPEVALWLVPIALASVVVVVIVLAFVLHWVTQRYPASAKDDESYSYTDDEGLSEVAGDDHGYLSNSSAGDDDDELFGL
jgi:hypothetical protein